MPPFEKVASLSEFISENSTLKEYLLNKNIINVKVMKTNLFILAFVLITELTNLYAQSKFSCELRPRFEYRNGYKTLRDSASKPAYLTSQRSRIKFAFEKDNISTQISVQDVRVWGEVKNKDDVASILLYEAWAELNMKSGFAIKAGRQELNYDDERLLSINNWNNVGATHDVAILKYKKSDFQAHLGLAYNNDVEKYFESNYPVKYYKSLSYLWLSYKLNNNLKTSVISIADGNQKDKSEKILYIRSTSGGNINYKSDSIGLYADLSGYYQFGKDVKGKDINAYFFSAKAGYFLTKKMDAFIAIAYFSGNDETDTANTKKNAFSNLYGMGHRFLGLMDYFTEIDKHTLGGGLIDYYGQLKYKLSSKITTSLAYHNFQLSGKLIDKTEKTNIVTLNKQLGSEIDFSIDYKINDMTTLQCGYSTMLAKKTLAIIKGGDYQKYTDWAWIMLTIKI
ncbi:MAG: hypothetical protein A2046_06125 [Bacteroidetes bacterium GWA2_30_7]|nr:MAG: hypothetical protein A2046_06125 [Bacteroidetes bacterium GWA2_30_7]